MFEEVVRFIRETFNDKTGFIPLHEPRFIGNEKKYLNDCIDSTFVSSVGKYVDQFEESVAKYTGAKYAIAAVNGTAALHISLILAGVKPQDLVITQPLSFVATCNAIAHANASPIFLDVDKETLGLSPEKLEEFLQENVEIRNNEAIHIETSKRISACVPMHTFGHPTKIDQIVAVCKKYNIPVIEDAAESIGSTYNQKHTGTFGLLGIYSFNGNKTITCGGGGIIVTDDSQLAGRAKHLTTTAKVPHPWEYIHNEVGYNYRLTNLSAALACAQMEMLDKFIENKRELASVYKNFFRNSPYEFIDEPENSKSNFWLNAILLEDKKERDAFLEYSNAQNVMTRPSWRLLNQLEMYKNCISGNLDNAIWLADRIVNLPSSVRV